MKKFIGVMAVAMTMICMTSCGGNGKATDSDVSSDNLEVVQDSVMVEEVVDTINAEANDTVKVDVADSVVAE